MAGIFDGLLGSIVPPTPGARPGAAAGPGPEQQDRSHSRSWSKSRGHKAWGKGHKAVKKP